MWIYHQRTGQLIGPRNSHPVAKGYSGRDEGKNNPDMQDRKNLGPIPRGKYKITEKFDSKLRGPFCLRLEPDPGNQMFGRSAFLIHGDSIKNPGTASQGCIILPRAIRELIWADGDRDLEVKE